MTVFRNPAAIPYIPDDFTIAQFIFRESLPSRPPRPRNVPYFIDDRSGHTLNYEEIHRRTFGLANALSIKWNIGINDVVCLLSPNHIDYANCVWAVHTLGGIVTPANPAYTADELVHQLVPTRTKVIITHPMCITTAITAAKQCGLPETHIILIQNDEALSGLHTLDQLIEFGADQPDNFTDICLKPGEGKTTVAFFCFSSGTTGKPKAVVISHYAVIANMMQMVAHFRINDFSRSDQLFKVGDRILGVLPFFHIYGLVVVVHFALFCGLSIVTVPKFNFEECLYAISRYQVTHLLLVPPQVVLLCKHPAAKGRNFNQVKVCMSGAAPLSGDLMSQIAQVFPNAVIGQGYGMTETSTTISLFDPNRKLGTLGSAGVLIPGIVAKVVKPDGTLGKEGEQGELIVTGPAMALGYYKNPTATAETFVDGWVRTGDEVIIRNNEVFIVDRVKEILKVRGFQVAPAELEGHLLLHPFVADACVVGIPDEYSVEVPLAFIVPTQAASRKIENDTDGTRRVRKEIEKHVSDAKVSYKWLKGGVVFIDKIPKNPSGKILRRFLRDQAKALKQPEITAKL